MRRFRAPLVVLCGVLCVAGLVFGVVFTYASRTFFDASRFSQRAAESLAEPSVARVVAEEITDQIIATRRDLTAYRPVIIGTVEYVVSSAPFRALVRRAAKRAHSTLISPTGENIALAVSDLGVVVRNALTMYPQVAEKIPESAQLKLGAPSSWPNGKNLARVLQMGHRLRVRSVVWLSVGFVAGICGVWLARRRDRFLLRVGLGLAITALVVGTFARFGGDLVALFTHSVTGKDLVSGLWPVFVGPLALRMLILGGIGLVIVAGVTSTLQKVRLADLARLVWGHISDRPGRKRWGVMRAFTFVVVGLVVALRPTHTIEIVMVVAGGLLFFFGVQEFFGIVARALPEAEAALEAAAEKRRSAWPRMAVIGGLVLVLAGAGAYWISRDDEPVAVAGTALDVCNLHPELCDRRLNEVAFATTHNSMSGADITDWMFPNQDKGIGGQLEDGVRGFLIDIHYGVPVDDRIKTMIEDETASMAKYEEVLGKEGIAAAMRIRALLAERQETGERDVYLCHGFCELGAERFVESLEEMKAFLIENPAEVVIIVVQDEGVTPADVAACFEKSGLVDFVYKGAVTPPWPTLREMIASDQRVLVFAENNAEGVPWYHHVWDVFQETPYRFLDPSEMSNKPARGETAGSLLLMNNWIETTPAPKPSNALIVNAYDFLLKRARACQRERKMMPNLIAVDYYHTGDLLRVVDTMNGIPEATVAAP